MLLKQVTKISVCCIIVSKRSSSFFLDNTRSRSDYECKLYARKSGPTVIEKTCATVESVLDYYYSAVWDMAFRIVSTIFILSL